MNKRVLNKVLLISLLVIWSVIIYKLFFGSSKKDVAFNAQDFITDNQPLKMVYRDTFILQEVLRDPFLDKTQKISSPEKQSFKIKPKQRSTKKAAWPKISYYGFVQSENNSYPLVLLTINNQLYRIRRGELESGVRVRSVFGDSVEVGYGAEVRVYVKE